MVGGGVPTPPAPMGGAVNPLLAALKQAFTGQLGTELPGPQVAPGSLRNDFAGGSPMAPASPVGPFKGLIEQGNIDLANRPTVKNSDGSISTVRSMSYRDNSGKEVLIPTVSDEGKVMSNREAIKYWGEKGQFIAKFDNPADADQYAQALHKSQEQRYTPKKGPQDLAPGTTAPAYDPSGLPPDPEDPYAPVADQPVKPPAMFIPPAQVSQSGSIPDSYYASIRQAESGGNDQAKNPTSSATGRYQFIGSTWEAVRQAHPELGLTPDGRRDPAQQERAIRAFTEDNANILRSSGVPITGGSLYAAHFLGAGGAKEVYRNPDDAAMVNVVGPGVISANGFLRGMTVGQFKQWAERKGGGGTGGPNYGPTSDAMSRPSGSQWSPAANGTGGSGGGFRMSEGEFNTATNAPANPKDRSRKGGGGSAGSGTGPDAGGGGGARKNDVSPDYKRYQARKNVRHLRGLSPVATIQAIANIGKGLRTQGGGQ